MADKKLKSCFQAHKIIVLTKQPIRLILIKPIFFGKMVKWFIKLSEFDLKYMPWTMIKTQALIDFVVKQMEDKQEAKQGSL